MENMKEQVKFLFLKEGVKVGRVKLNLIADEVAQEMIHLPETQSEESKKLRGVADHHASEISEGKKIRTSELSSVNEKVELKQGDLVQIDRLSGWDSHLSLSRDYVVEKAAGGLIYIKDETGFVNPYLAIRFSLVKSKSDVELAS